MTDRMSLEYLSPFEVANLLSTDRKVLIIDVRDDDRSVGWIPDSYHLPSDTLTRSVMEAFLRRHLDDQSHWYLIFHCMYSKQRGPAAAFLCMEVLESMKNENENSLFRSSKQMAQVFILRGGFISFHKAFPDKVIS
mmetsp:Transcript_9232/g.13991  ORF Transcript_9232/g.13991 Transcript_9232/m.13991 type:complete len:136 (-) Transcript_9232:46-453(-)